MSLLQMSLSGAAMILIIVMIRALALYRLPKRFFLVLWGAVILRLLLPVPLPSAISIYSLMEQADLAAGFQQDGSLQTDSLQDDPALRPAPDPGDPDVSAAQTGRPAVSVLAETADAMDMDIGTAVWLAGVCACTMTFGLTWLRCRRRFRESLPVDHPYAADWLRRSRQHRQCRRIRQHPLCRRVAIRQSDRIDAPLTYGICRPVILMPKNTDWDDTETLDYVLAHEWVHIRRFDAVYKLFLTAALCIHWFNPFVWAMVILANRDIELSCDEAVLRRFGTEARGGYALALIRMEEHKSGLALSGSHFSKNAIEERITAIMKIKKKSLITLIVSAVLACGSMAVFATSARAETGADGTDPQLACVSRVESIVMSRTDPDGTVHYVVDDGENRTEMTEEEFKSKYTSQEVEWWTADEYAAWLEEEKVKLQEIIGTKGWTRSTGWFTWTQEMVDATIVKYELTLQEIRNGLHLSKPVPEEREGAYDTAVMYSYEPSRIGTEGECAEDELTGSRWTEEEYAARLEEEKEELQETLRYIRTEEMLAPYLPFGLTSRTSADGQLTMTWQDQPVRSLYDPERQIWVANSVGEGGLGPDAINLEAVYENGNLTGLRQIERDFELYEGEIIEP